MQGLGGGSINESFALLLAGGGRAFVKTRPGADPEEYAAEAAGLRWLAEGAAPVPEVLAVGSDPPYLALEWIEPGALSPAGAERLGRELAELHALGAPAHGWHPGRGSRQRIGELEIEARAGPDWPQVYAAQRLLPLARRARDQGALSAAGATAVESVCARIAELAGPPEPPARLHGDLWLGNLHADAEGNGWLIDPVAHGGHRELDLAMLRLFGSPGEQLFDAYEEAAPLAPGHAERLPLWQLQPLLVHAVLFGGGYGARAERAARAYL
jgi:fructosamine-3-kinase